MSNDPIYDFRIGLIEEKSDALVGEVPLIGFAEEINTIAQIDAVRWHVHGSETPRDSGAPVANRCDVRYIRATPGSGWKCVRAGFPSASGESDIDVDSVVQGSAGGLIIPKGHAGGIEKLAVGSLQMGIIRA